jgi:subtilisin family serine protease
LALAAGAQSAAAAPASDTVLVKVEPAATASERAEVARALDADGSRPLMAGWRAYEVDGTLTLTGARRLLAGADAVEAVQLDVRVHPLADPDDTYYGLQWPLPKIDAPAGWDLAAGAEPVTVAVTDEGVQTDHPDLAARIWQNAGETPGNGLDDDGNGYADDVAGWNFYDGNNDVYDPAHGDDHGTHVAGTVAAVRGNGTGVAGVAGNAVIMPLKFLGPDGGYTSDAIAAIDYAVANGARVINASWGGDAYSAALCDAIELAGDAGVVVVAAAGNDGTNNDASGSWPSNCPATSLISVAATTSSDGLASFSNYGALQVDVGAPGNGVLSTYPGSAYAYMSGTSMAAPHVSGIAAALMGLHPEMAPWQVAAAVSSGGQAVPALAGTTRSGRRVSLAGALSASAGGIGPDVTAPDSFATLSPAPGEVTSSARPIFRWTPATDAESGVSTYRLTVDGVVLATPQAGTTSVLPGASLADGAHSWQVVAEDGAGNTRATDAHTFVVDRTAPTSPPLSSPIDEAEIPGPEVELSWGAAQDAASGVASYKVVVDGVAVAHTPATVRSFRVSLAKGAHIWQVVAVDAAGNQSSGASRTLTVTGVGGGSKPAASFTFRAPPPIRPGQRALLRLRLVKGARVTFSVKLAGSVRPLGAFVARVHAGAQTVRMPTTIARRMRRPGRYTVTARITGLGTVTVRGTIRR